MKNAKSKTSGADRSVATGSPFHKTKALVMGVGLHGGGVATIKWLAKQGAQVTATDMRDKKVLAPALRLLRGTKAIFVLGKHREKDFRTHDLIIVNPAVPRESPHLAIAKDAGKRIENVASLFFRSIENPSIAVTGTRGKTTTTLWVAELLKKKYPHVRQSGTPENALLDEHERLEHLPLSARKMTPIIAELSSWQLEYLPESGRAPHIAAITNIYPEHLNRYRDINDYADAKANIFKNQKVGDMLVLNFDNKWHRYFFKKKPRSVVYYISKNKLPKNLNGSFTEKDWLVVRVGGKEQRMFSVARFRAERGEHNLENLVRAVLLAKLFEPTIKVSEKDALLLPSPRMRQETIYRKGQLMIINDSCATSPDGTIAALDRFSHGARVILIVGGTDKKLEFGGLAKKIASLIRDPEDLILLDGSATRKLEVELVKLRWNVFQKFDSLGGCIRMAFLRAQKNTGPTVVLFSPAAASFEKFLHEFDRGEKFNREVVKLWETARVV